MGRYANLEDGFAGTWVGHWVVVDIRTEEDRAKGETLVSDLIPYEILTIDNYFPRWPSSRDLGATGNVHCILAAGRVSRRAVAAAEANGYIRKGKGPSFPTHLVSAVPRKKRKR